MQGKVKEEVQEETTARTLENEIFQRDTDCEIADIEIQEEITLATSLGATFPDADPPQNFLDSPLNLPQYEVSLKSKHHSMNRLFLLRHAEKMKNVER